MQLGEVLADGFGRVKEEVHAVLDGISTDTLAYRPSPDANPVGWLVWHLTRVQDDHVSEAAGRQQQWVAGWADRFDLPYDPRATGWSQTAEEVAEFRVGSADLLAGYYDAVHEQTLGFVLGLGPDDLDRVVDRRWDPPVTLGVRLVSVIADDLEHVGQAAYVRGIVPVRSP